MTPIQKIKNLPKLHHELVTTGNTDNNRLEAMGVTNITGQTVTIKCDVEKFKEAFKEYNFNGQIKYYGLILNFVE